MKRMQITELTSKLPKKTNTWAALNKNNYIHVFWGEIACDYIQYLTIYFFLQCPHLYICIVCMYIWLNCIYLYLNVYCQCLMLTVCTKGLRVTQFQFSVCMYCTCGRIDNKADLTWLDMSEYTPHILVNILLYLIMWHHWRNDTLLQCKKRGCTHFCGQRFRH